MKKKLSSLLALILLGAAYLLFADKEENQSAGTDAGSGITAGTTITGTGAGTSGRAQGSTASGIEIPAPDEADHIVAHEAYTSSYNTTTLIPNWVAYELTKEETYGDIERGDRMFSMDPDFKMRQAKREDYYNSGWTKGHLIPASDVRWSSTGMDETFYFTNVCPQNEVLNAGDWEFLERQVRRWAREFGSVYVVTGPIVGTGRYGTIGERNVTVPDSFFKAVVCCNDGSYQGIAFVMDNDEERYYLADCAMSIDSLEKMTGLDLFPALDDKIENAIEARYSLKDWGIRTR